MKHQFFVIFGNFLNGAVIFLYEFLLLGKVLTATNLRKTLESGEIVIFPLISKLWSISGTCRCVKVNANIEHLLIRVIHRNTGM